MSYLNLLFPNQAPSPIAFVVIAVLLVWSTVWKGFALWKSARLSQQKWFVVLLIVNSLGILEIIYIFFVAGKNKTSDTNK